MKKLFVQQYEIFRRLDYIVAELIILFLFEIKIMKK